MIRKRFVFNGRVQGVGFRYLTRRAADLIGVKAYDHQAGTSDLASFHPGAYSRGPAAVHNSL